MNTKNKFALKPNPDKPEPGKKERPVEPKVPEIKPAPEELPVPKPEQPDRIAPDLPKRQDDSVLSLAGIRF